MTILSNPSVWAFWGNMLTALVPDWLAESRCYAHVLGKLVGEVIYMPHPNITSPILKHGFMASKKCQKIYQSLSVDNPKILCIEHGLMIAFRCRQRTAKTWRSSWRPRSSSVPPRTGWTWTKRSTNLFASSVASRLKPVSSSAIVTPWKTNGNHEKNYVIIAKISTFNQSFAGSWEARGSEQKGDVSRVEREMYSPLVCISTI